MDEPGTLRFDQKFGHRLETDSSNKTKRLVLLAAFLHYCNTSFINTDLELWSVEIVTVLEHPAIYL